MNILASMTLEERIALCSGADFWTTKAFPSRGIPAVTMCDGPHGLRKQRDASDHLGMYDSIPATCFPTSSATGCSWDRALLREIGSAIAEEALQEGVCLVLGPSANIQRNPLGGRNFEYFSEDPLLSGELAAAWIEGVQGRGVGACIKHFAANSQENRRMTSNSVVDERTLREIYLPAFERAVRGARPKAVMTAYNQVNGEHCCRHAGLLRRTLREVWGFEGVTMTDWGAMNDRAASFRAGLDLEMPGGASFFDHQVREAIQRGELPEGRVDECASRVADMARALGAKRWPGHRYDPDRHHALAKRAAIECAVLLKNEEDLLPLAPEVKIAVIGATASAPRYQGTGSSRIRPTRLVSALEGLEALGRRYRYAEGHPLRAGLRPGMRNEAAEAARSADVAVVFAGLPDIADSEGFDRSNMELPASQDDLIRAVAEVQPNTVVVLAGGSPVRMPWVAKVKAVLQMHLAGQAGGLAAAELLTGAASPGGRLAVTYPVRYEDVPSAQFFGAGGDLAEYREGVYVGYRYYDKAGAQVLFPFGHGLSYTRFEYRDLLVREAGGTDHLEVECTVRNAGRRDGSEVVQVYVGSLATGRTGTYRPKQELRAFEKAHVRAGEARPVRFLLDRRAFAWYDAKREAWVVPGGTYRISIGASSRDIRLVADVRVRGDPNATEPQAPSSWYAAPGTGAPSRGDFEALLGRRIEDALPASRGAYTLDSTLWDMRSSLVIRIVMAAMERTIRKGVDASVSGESTLKMIFETVRHSPIRSLSLTSPDGMRPSLARGLVAMANGRYLRGLRELWPAWLRKTDRGRPQ